MIRAYRGLGNKTDGNELFESCPEVLPDIFIIVKISIEPAKSAADRDDDQNNEEKYNTFEAVNDLLGGLLVSNLFPSRSGMILALYF